MQTHIIIRRTNEETEKTNAYEKNAQHRFFLPTRRTKTANTVASELVECCAMAQRKREWTWWKNFRLQSMSFLWTTKMKYNNLRLSSNDEIKKIITKPANDYWTSCFRWHQTWEEVTHDVHSMHCILLRFRFAERAKVSKVILLFLNFISGWQIIRDISFHIYQQTKKYKKRVAWLEHGFQMSDRITNFICLRTFLYVDDSMTDEILLFNHLVCRHNNNNNYKSSARVF